MTHQDERESNLGLGAIAEVIVDPSGRIQRYNAAFAEAIAVAEALDGKDLDAVVSCLGLADDVAGVMAKLVDEGADEVLVDAVDANTGFCDLTIRATKREEGLAFRFLPRLQSLRHRQRRQHAEELAASVAQLAGGVAHDFNNLLTGIIGLASFLNAELPSESEYQEDLRDILQAAKKATRLARKLTSLGRESSDGEAIVDPSRVIQEVVHLVEPSLPAGCELFTELEWDGLLQADPLALERIVLNLLLNARDACGADGGNITVSTRRVLLEGDDKTSCLPAGEYFELAVGDDGPGIPPEQMLHIFRPYYTTKHDSGGEGLGLTASRASAEQLRGELVVDSIPGNGACFTLRVPLDGSNVD
ncbi:sensor histidine kinase [Persicimonas caeni]|nr:ATP-binding protein [Persicimonas caeni]